MSSVDRGWEEGRGERRTGGERREREKGREKG